MNRKLSGSSPLTRTRTEPTDASGVRDSSLSSRLDSQADAAASVPPTAATVRPILASVRPEVDFPDTGTAAATQDSAIGDILRVTNGLSDKQVDTILAYQRQHHVKFGEAAIALKLAKSEDVIWALAQQFQYAYTPGSDLKLSPELVVASQPFSDAAELFRDIRSQLMMNVLEGGARRALCIVSPNIGDGKSFFAANLAVAFSQLGGRTLLIDADMRTPRQQDIFGATAGGGLSGILSGRAKANVQRPIAALPSLYVLPVGAVPPNPLELVQRPTFALLIKGVLNKFDHVIVDTPAAEHGADARVIASRCGAALAIGRKNKTQMANMQTLVNQVTKSTENFAGVVMNEF